MYVFNCYINNLQINHINIKIKIKYFLVKKIGLMNGIKYYHKFRNIEF